MRSACRCISSSAATNISTSSGKSFRDFFAGKLDELPGERPTISDWANHLSTIFPEVRLKRYLEMRGADGGPWRRLPSLTAFWVGLLYDDDALDACWDLVKGWSAAERQKLRDDVPRLGFNAEIRGRNVLTLAQETLRFAARGLARRKYLDRNGRDETRYLRPLEESIARGITPAEELLEKFHGEWKGSVEPIFEEYAYCLFASTAQVAIRPRKRGGRRGANSAAAPNIERGVCATRRRLPRSLRARRLIVIAAAVDRLYEHRVKLASCSRARPYVLSGCLDQDARRSIGISSADGRDASEAERPSVREA